MNRWFLAGLTAAATLAASPAAARTPNAEGVETTPGGSAFFSFLHRFQVGAPPTYAVTNLPTFHLSGGWGELTAFGTLYATETLTVPGAAQELELFAKHRLLDERDGWPLSLAARGAFNVTALSPDVELTAARTSGPLGLLAALRGLGNYQFGGAPQLAAVLGGRLAITDHVDVVGDVGGGWPNVGPGGAVVWGAGLAMRIPFTPHTLSLQASNASTTTTHGAAVATSAVRYGFDFTIPFSSARPWLEMWRRSGDGARAAAGGTPSGHPSVEAPAAGLTAPEPPPKPGPKPATGASSGAAIFAARCASCHGADGQGAFGPDLRPSGAKGDEFIAERIRKGSPKGMPPFAGQLSQHELDALVSFVKSL